MVTEEFQVPGVSCQHCVRAITHEVSGIEGIKSVQVAIDTKRVLVSHSGSVPTAIIISAINEAGFEEVTPV